MPLLIEDGSNVAGANSYATRAEIIAYAAARGITIADAGASDVFAINAMDYIELKDYKGEPTYGVVTVDQPLQFPRKDITIGLVTLAEDVIPLALVNAQCELAMQNSTGIDLMPTRAAGPSIKREKLDVIETEYFETKDFVDPFLPRVDALLKPLLTVGFGPLAAVRV